MAHRQPSSTGDRQGRNDGNDVLSVPHAQEKDQNSDGLLYKVSSTTSERSPRNPDVLREGDIGEAPLFSRPRNRMPYFRWLGPTAIMPGFKQMVVKVKRQDPDISRSSTDGGVMSPSLNNYNIADQRASSLYSNTPAAVESDVRTPLSLPFYDTSPMPPSELITHLVNTFFTHLGCNYPFLQRERFLRDLEEKQVDAILVDAVCALAARFSKHPLLTHQPHDETKSSPAEYGHAFAQRAKTALVDTFPCPSVAAVQAALLLAYNEFGESRDSGLWMYLGIAIRMAQDLGLHKLEGLKYKGVNGPTPKMVKRESLAEATTTTQVGKQVQKSTEGSSKELEDESESKNIDEQKAVEQERVDTFWAVFFLDRVVSSGTGRRSTLRDKDIELAFPNLDEGDYKSGWPAVFPALIRIVHLYGRVADLLNSIKEPPDISSDTPKRLAAMEKQVTLFYQGLPQNLHFNAVNFQHYMKAGEGTNFVLLHFWFHTLIVLLHQPTLLKTFEGKMLQLFPNSRQLSMSSAKTIADILSYSQLMDAKAPLGNPFTTQPIYIAACAFLKETAEQTASSNVQSRANSPSRKDTGSDSGPPSASGTPQNPAKALSVSGANGRPATSDQKTLAKHTLLATAATQHYQLCYKALQSIETYWAGTKYILTILDQKFEGVDDPLLYTVEEGESSIEQPRPEPAFTSPGWRRKLSWGPYLGNPNQFFRPQTLTQVPGSPGVDPSKAIGWTLTGTMNSPSTNLAWHYTSDGTSAAQVQDQQNRGHTIPASMSTQMNGQYSQHHSQTDTSNSHPMPDMDQLAQPTQMSSYTNNTPNPSHADASLLLGLGSSYQPNNTVHATSNSMANFTPQQSDGCAASFAILSQPLNMGLPWPSYFVNGSSSMQNFGDMMIESQDVDMSMLGLDMMPWFDSYPTHDVMNIFDAAGGAQDPQGTQHHQ